MISQFVLLHSLALGPATWQPVAEWLRAGGHTVVVPDLRNAITAETPHWPHVVDVVGEAIGRLDVGAPVVLAVHSNTGRLVPHIVERAGRSLAACLFVDAALPARHTPTAVADEGRLAVLRALSKDGWLPPWTQWWAEQDVAQLLPHATTRAAVVAEQPRLPVSYYEQEIPQVVGWAKATACGYLLFGPPYDEQARDAAGRGWLVEQEPGLHLNQVVDPAGVARRLQAMTQQLHRTPG